MRANEEALAKANQELEAIKARVNLGEDVSMKERRAALEKIKRLKEDQGLIEIAGM